MDASLNTRIIILSDAVLDDRRDHYHYLRLLEKRTCPAAYKQQTLKNEIKLVRYIGLKNTKATIVRYRVVKFLLQRFSSCLHRYLRAPLVRCALLIVVIFLYHGPVQCTSLSQNRTFAVVGPAL